jgi:serine/alanine racemase
MDQLTADVTEISGVQRGDIAVLIGKSGDAEISAGELAENADTITNEILSRLGERLTRVFVK